MGSLPELRYLDSPRHAPRRSFGAATGLQVRPPAGRGGKYERGALRLDSGQALTPALLEIHCAAGRRRESCSSSVGAASVRRLVRGGGGGGGGGARAPRQEDEVRAAWMRRAAAACVARAFAAAALLPLMAIQGSMSPWSNGPVLLSALHGASALSALTSPALLRAATPSRALTVIYFLLAVFFLAHLVPEFYILLPLYLAAGLCWTPLLLAHDSILGELACEGNFQTLPPHNPHGAVSGLQSERRTLLRRLTRASRIARDTGLLFAALMLPLIPSRSVVSSPSIIADFNNTNCLLSPPCSSELYGLNNASILVESVFVWEESKSKQNATDKTWIPIETEEELEGWREEACGSRGCPGNDIPDGSDCREEISVIDDIPYCLCLFCMLASLLSLWCWTEGRGRGAPPAGGPLPWRAALMAITDPRMRMAGPLAFFIGLEQGFLYAHFMKWYVVCVGGGSQVWSVLAAVAVLRSLVSATLSMLLAHGRRRLVAGGGLVWHACLLLALGAWRAARADMQLPPVMAAAWAGCGAVWDLLLPTLVDEPVPAGRAALALSFRALGLSVAFLARSTLCARWALRALFLALPAAALPLLFAPDR